MRYKALEFLSLIVIFSEEHLLVSFINDHLLINETEPKEDLSVPSTSYSSYNRTLMETLVPTEQAISNSFTLICPVIPKVL